jgi:hypothetical protein
MALSETELKNIRDVALHALKNLHSLSNVVKDINDPLTLKIRKGLGLAIGTIDLRILEIIYSKYPEWDDNPLTGRALEKE